MSTKPHPNAEILRAIADGKTVQLKSKLLGSNTSWWDWDYEKHPSPLNHLDIEINWRVKPETVLINGIECPAPMRFEPNIGSVVYCPSVFYEAVYSDAKEKVIHISWDSGTKNLGLFKNGLLFSTPEDAHAVAEAMIAPLKAKS